MTNWQPIETAPKDGTRILIYDPTHYRDPIITIAEYRCGGWLGEDGGVYDCCSSEYEPTHWMPLPLPPKND